LGHKPERRLKVPDPRRCSQPQGRYEHLLLQ
jgi:hypothetical protein